MTYLTKQKPTEVGGYAPPDFFYLKINVTHALGLYKRPISFLLLTSTKAMRLKFFSNGYNVSSRMVISRLKPATSLLEVTWPNLTFLYMVMLKLG